MISPEYFITFSKKVSRGLKLSVFSPICQNPLSKIPLISLELIFVLRTFIISIISAAFFLKFENSAVNSGVNLSLSSKKSSSPFACSNKSKIECFISWRDVIVLLEEPSNRSEILNGFKSFFVCSNPADNSSRTTFNSFCAALEIPLAGNKLSTATLIFAELTVRFFK